MADSSPLVTLTTDFGTKDPYVSAMKGVIYSQCPGVRVVDLSHDIPPQDLWHACFFWAGSAPYFPPGTIHIAIVDPGVGTARRAVVAKAGGQYFVCPDNGILTMALLACPLEEAYAITNPDFMAADVSPTFHGRDVFAPTAARLASGVDIAEAGEAAPDLVALPIPDPVTRDEAIEGEIIHIDHFGNCISNVTRATLASKSPQNIRIGAESFESILDTYGQAQRGEALALFGSSGHLELAVREDSASDRLGIRVGDPVRVML
jgi:S-adenosylmethionine hydrolase